jgi:hypothetical protein
MLNYGLIFDQRIFLSKKFLHAMNFSDLTTPTSGRQLLTFMMNKLPPSSDEWLHIREDHDLILALSV